jgi:hypothetical protein
VLEQELEGEHARGREHEQVERVDEPERAVGEDRDIGRVPRRLTEARTSSSDWTASRRWSRRSEVVMSLAPCARAVASDHA